MIQESVSISFIQPLNFFIAMMKINFQFLPFAALIVASTVLSLDPVKNRVPLSPSTAQTGGGDDQPDFIYYGAGPNGGGISMEKTDSTISKAMSWGQKFTVLQFDQKHPAFSDPNSFAIPSTFQYDAKQNIPIGTNFFLSCYDDDLFNRQHDLNVQCSKDPSCSTSYMVTVLWGTLGSMNFRKDRILLATCGIVKVDGGSACNFPNSPACKVQLFQDYSQQHFSGLMQTGEAVQVGIVGSTAEVPNALQSFATKTKQHITLPSGAQTS